VGVRLQGGDVRVIDDPDRLPSARHTRTLRAPRAGWIARLDAGALGRAATLLGAGRLRKEDDVAPGAGIQLHAKVGARVASNEPLCTLAFDDPARERMARALVAGAFGFSPRRPPDRKLVLGKIG
jgi:thymidine phosphorylase